ncbi:glycosyltransferase family 2 protein [Solwaraspora sp. WMMD406]|uniref:glycosyltransferase family 2 protein n=1 Tax=Solwaraspora sp. WMMD406 TaxID=3016095 RepID=UPI002415A4E7|nr:glycosyltransferase family 2 protein [Solwaraspora sp. WMMD406]MDG4762587.1 glycosyltransferase family 2 protein [Solwaraspora sp. WMMD406]
MIAASGVDTSVSVVLPVYNTAGTIAACLRSVAAQTLRPSQVILVDDCGGDDAIEVARRTLADVDLPYLVLRHDRNRRIGAARNTGLARATGEWIWFLDSDDQADPTFLARLVAAATDHRADLAVCRTRRVDPAGNQLDVVEPRWRRPAVTGEQAARLLLADRMKAYACNKVFRRRILPAAPFDLDRSYEDFRPALRTLLRATSVALVDEPLYRYTVDPSSVSGHFGRHTFDLLTVADDVHAELVRRGLSRRWRTDQLTYLIANVVLPLANMALRAEHAGRVDDTTRAAVAAARRRTRVVDLVRLLAAGRIHPAVAGGVLKAAPALYARVLARR